MHALLDLIGIFAFGISGALMAISRDFEIVGRLYTAEPASKAATLNPKVPGSIPGGGTAGSRAGGRSQVAMTILPRTCPPTRSRIASGT